MVLVIGTHQIPHIRVLGTHQIPHIRVLGVVEPEGPPILDLVSLHKVRGRVPEVGGFVQIPDGQLQLFVVQDPYLHPP